MEPDNCTRPPSYLSHDQLYFGVRLCEMQDIFEHYSKTNVDYWNHTICYLYIINVNNIESGDTLPRAATAVLQVLNTQQLIVQFFCCHNGDLISNLCFDSRVKL